MHDPDERDEPEPTAEPAPLPAATPPPDDLTPEELAAIEQARREAAGDPDAVDDDCGVS